MNILRTETVEMNDKTVDGSRVEQMKDRDRRRQMVHCGDL